MKPTELKALILRYLGAHYFSKEFMPALRTALVELVADIDRITQEAGE